MSHFHSQELLVYLNDNTMHSPYHPICRRKIYYTKVIGLKYVWWLIYCCAGLQSGWRQDNLRDASVIILQRFMIIFDLLFPVTFNLLRCMMCNWCAQLSIPTFTWLSVITLTLILLFYFIFNYGRWLKQNPEPSGYFASTVITKKSWLSFKQKS